MNRLNFLLLLLGAIFYWAAGFPLGLWFLVFLVPFVWTPLHLSISPPKWWMIYGVAFTFWIASIWWIACPHPATSLGLIALSAYLAIYWPIFFAATRSAVFRFRIPILLAAPICWIGCESLRNFILGGFSFCAMEHTLVFCTPLIQIADIAGGVFVGGMIVFVGTGCGVSFTACIDSHFFGKNCQSIEHSENAKPTPTRFLVPSFRTAIVSSILSFCALTAVLLYGICPNTVNHENGNETLRGETGDERDDSVQVTLLQGNIQISLASGPEKVEQTFEQFMSLMLDANQTEIASSQLIVWPETTCPISVLEFSGKTTPNDLQMSDSDAAMWKYQLRQIAARTGVPILFGLSTFRFGDDIQPDRLNSALYVSPNPDVPIGPRYDKVHLVMFGEYIPFSSLLPNDFFLKSLCQEAKAGTEPVAIPITKRSAAFHSETEKTIWGAVNICFESSSSHLIRHQILSLEKKGMNPSILINLSNDGWFHCSQQIDQHFATHVFRAVENRLPYITATNGGFAAIINSCGQIVARGKRGEAAAVTGTVVLSNQTPIYHKVGSIPAGFCAAITIFLLFSQRKTV
ncbi:MAG: apolipoprotein N-acyltransferase [Thermoguttaceae bacterium]